jgi:galactitol PTS system EIIB component
MSKPKRILVACGSALATSTVILRKLKKALSEKGIAVELDQCKAEDLERKANDFDLIVSTTIIDRQIDIPIVYSVAFLTGQGIEQDLEKIIAKLEG